MKVQIDRDIERLLQPLTEEEYAGLRVKLQTDGCTEPLPYAVIGGVNIQLDGHHRRRICITERIEHGWRLIESVTTKDEALEWVERHQNGRRNSTPEQQALVREKRRQRIVEARKEGQSTRTIAEREKVSQSTVRNDLEASGEQGCSPEPPNGQINGKDGKTYTETRPVPTRNARKPRKPKNGREVYDLKQFGADLGVVVRHVDGLARHFGVGNGTYTFEAMRKQLKEFDAAFRALHKTLTTTPKE